MRDDVGARVVHKMHGAGAVVEILEDGRTRIRFDSGEEHRYKPASMHKLKHIALKKYLLVYCCL